MQKKVTSRGLEGGMQMGDPQNMQTAPPRQVSHARLHLILPDQFRAHKGLRNSLQFEKLAFARNVQNVDCLILFGEFWPLCKRLPTLPASPFQQDCFQAQKHLLSPGTWRGGRLTVQAARTAGLLVLSFGQVT